MSFAHDEGSPAPAHLASDCTASVRNKAAEKTCSQISLKASLHSPVLTSLLFFFFFFFLFFLPLSLQICSAVFF